MRTDVADARLALALSPPAPAGRGRSGRRRRGVRRRRSWSAPRCAPACATSRCSASARPTSLSAPRPASTAVSAAAMAVAAPDTVGQTDEPHRRRRHRHPRRDRAHGGGTCRCTASTIRSGRFHGVAPVALSGREAAVSEQPGAESNAADGDALVLRASGPSDVPLATLQGRRDDAGVRIRVTKAAFARSRRAWATSRSAGAGPRRCGLRPAVAAPAGAEDRRPREHHPRAASGAAQQTPEPRTVEAVQRAWLAGAALPDHGVRIRRVPGDRVMALEGLGGTSARTSCPASRAH